MSEMLIDSTKLTASLTATANAIRRKTGNTEQISYDYENGNGFKSAVDEIETPILQSKTLTLGASAPSNVSPDDEYNGLSGVSVSVDSTVIKPENIAQGVTILGVEGTHSGGEEYPDLTDAPIPDGYEYVAYVAIDASPDFPHHSEVTNSRTIQDQIIAERGTYADGVWTVESTESFSKDVTLDWSDVQSGFVLYRFLIGTDHSTGQSVLQTYVPAVSVLISSDITNVGNKLGSGLYAKQIIADFPINNNGSESILSHVFKNHKPYWLSQFVFKNTITNGNNGRTFYMAFDGLSVMKNFSISSTPTHYYYANGFGSCFRNCSSIESIDLSMVRPQNTMSFSSAFQDCISLKTVNLSNLGSGYITPGTSAFSGCYFLENILLDKTVFASGNISMADCRKLTNASLVNIANALPESTSTITFHAVPKAHLSTIIGTVSTITDELGERDVFTEDEDGDTTLTQFIALTKGWTVA